MKLQVLNIKGETVGREIELSDEIFGAVPNEHVLYLAVKKYLAAQRTGTHSAKEVSQLSGSTRKLKRQKGTGTARSGSIKSPLFKGGARVFGPRPRSYDIKLNKKVRRLAKISALSAKSTASQLKVVENFSIDTPKTKVALGLVNALKSSESGRTLVVVEKCDTSIVKSFNNLPNAKVVTADSLNVYDVLNASTLLLTEGSVDFLQTSLQLKTA